MESYIVRIYRFHRGNPRNLVGIVESVGDAEGIRRAFTNLDDLWNILNSKMPERPHAKHRSGGKEVKTSTPAFSMDVLAGTVSRVVVDARNLSKGDRGLLIEMALKKTGRGEIITLADNDASEDISQTAKKEGWSLNGIDSRGDGCRITISK